MSYKTIAINAAQVARDYQISPEKTWRFFSENIFPDSRSQQEKGCPKNTFLGLCQEGKVIGIPSGQYTSSQHNKRYALRALEILQTNESNNFTSSDLWKKVLESEADSNKASNGQMEVVLGLWDKGLLQK